MMSIISLLLYKKNYLNKDFLSSFITKEKAEQTIKKPEDLVFIKKEFIIPYLEFVKKNKKIMKIIHDKPSIFNNEKVYDNMKRDIFIPAVAKHNVPKEEQHYIIEFFTKGVVAIVGLWLKNDCLDPVEDILKIILKCVGYNQQLNSI